MSDRITRRIGNKVEFVDGKGYANLSQGEGFELVMKRLADCEDQIDKNSVTRAFFEVENWLYGGGKDKPLEIKSAILWGALLVTCYHGDMTWDSIRHQFGEFMSKQMNLR